MPRQLSIVLFALFLTPALLLAAAPQTMSFQALLDSNGVALDGTYGLTFAIYDTLTGGAALWTETHAAVAVVDGVASVVLGSVNPLGALPFDEPYWLGITIGGGTELTPRTALTGAPYSMNARNVDNGVVVKSVNGLKDDVVIAGGMNVTVAESLNTVVISASAGAAADSDWTVAGDDIHASLGGDVGIGNAAPAAKLHILGGDAGTGLALDVDDQLYVNSTTPFVGVGRSLRVNSTEVFGLGSSNSGYAGMYIRSTSSGGLPYYGYFTPGGSMYHYYAASDQKWRMYNNGVRMTLQPDGKLGIGTDVPAERLDVNGNIAADANARIGQHPLFGSNYAAFWNDLAPSYALLASTTNTYLNAPNGSLYFRIGNSTKVSVTSSSGSASVSLPADAVSSSEMENEAGAASNLNGTSTFTLAGGGVETILSRTITAPTSGYVLVIATAQVNLGHTNGSQTYGDFGVSDVSTSLPVNQDVDVAVAPGAASGTYRQATTVHGLFSVSAGARTFYFLGYEYGGNITLNDPQLSLIFVPTSYGSVVSTLTGQTNIPDEEAPAAPALTAADLDRERTESIADNEARIAAELAELRERMNALEGLLE